MKKICAEACLVAASLVVAAGCPLSAFAISDAQKKFFGQNNIIFYDPDGGGGGGCSSGSVSGATIEEKIWNGLVGFMTPEQAAGVMGNMMHESLGNPAMHEQSLKNRYQPGFNLGANPNVSYGLGLIQWSYGRRVRMYNYVASVDSTLTQYLDDYNTYARDYSYDGAKFLSLAGDDVTNRLVAAELEFLKDELQNDSSYNGIFQETTVEGATRFFLLQVERPLYPNLTERLKSANNFYEHFKDSVGSGGSSGICSGGESDKPIEPLNESSVDVPCDSRTIDLGVINTAYYQGTQISIRLCSIPNIKDVGSDKSTYDPDYVADGNIHVNSRVSGAFFALSEEHNRRCGNYLRATQGYRSAGLQQHFYDLYTQGRGNLAAAPGYSNHQTGLAIDFDTSSYCRTDPSVASGGIWNLEFLAQFGLDDGRNFSQVEYWHVDPIGY